MLQVWTCDYEGCNIRNPDADDVQIGLEVYRQHIAATTSGRELMGGGSKRLPCNVKSDEMGKWIWICEGLVIVFLTETRHRLLSSVNGGRESSNARAFTQAEELTTPPVFRDTPG